jgi:predicted RNA-binding Zn-ribbon protein involved in translation (DUF1610 family)
MSSGSFTVEHPCPQCGAPVILEEADRLISCGHCRVSLYFYGGMVFRYYLPPLPAVGEEPLFVPYWHLRGAFFCLESFEVRGSIRDVSMKAAGPAAVPPTLGLRAQAMKLKLAGPGVKGRFLRPAFGAAELVSKVVSLPGARDGPVPRVIYHTFIGETTSLIYAPLYLRGGKVFDAVLDRPWGTLGEGEEESLKEFDDPSSWEAAFLPALCPNCGWDLPGGRKSVALICGNCSRGWQAVGGAFRPLDYGVQVVEEGGDRVYLPFWRMEAGIEGLELVSFADLARLANLPRTIRKEWEERALEFWAPAFRVRTNVFLRLARQLTSTPLDLRVEERVPGNSELFPATLVMREALESVKITLAGMAARKREIFPLLPAVKVRLRRTSLVYLPFAVRGGDFIQEEYGVSFRRNALRP